MKIKPIESSDIAKIAVWNRELHEDEGSTPMDTEAAEKRLSEWLRTGKFEGGIFQEGDLEIGYILVERIPAVPDERGSVDCFYIRQFFIVREHRRQAMGSKAYKYFIEHNLPRGIRITLDVKATNPRGQKFWESLGFIPQHIAYQLG